jgi:hypothetical protein
VLWLIGWDRSVGIATRYADWTVRGSNTRWGRDFPHLSRSALGPTQAHTVGTGSFPGVKRPGRYVDHPPPSGVEVKERVLPMGLRGLF